MGQAWRESTKGPRSEIWVEGWLVMGEAVVERGCGMVRGGVEMEEGGFQEPATRLETEEEEKEEKEEEEEEERKEK